MWHTQHFTTNPKKIVTPAPILDVLQTTVRKHTLLTKNLNVKNKVIYSMTSDSKHCVNFQISGHFPIPFPTTEMTALLW